MAIPEFDALRSKPFQRAQARGESVGLFLRVRTGTCPIVPLNKHVPLDEKLAVLQEVDAFRKWSSLDDRRVCVRCEKVINGRMIDVWQDTRGAFHLHCPTPGCPATARDWLYREAKRTFPARVSKSWAPAIGFGSPASS